MIGVEFFVAKIINSNFHFLLIMAQDHILREKKDYTLKFSRGQAIHPWSRHIFGLLPNHTENMWEYKGILFSSSVINIFDKAVSV